MKIYLIGMPGSGKTTLGKQLAENLVLEFVDLDDEIEKQEGKSIPEIFRTKGEDYFRLIESDVLCRWAAFTKGFVMAAGGGAPCFHKGIGVINRTGISVFLDTTVDEILQRLASASDRPLLQSKDVDEKKKKLHELRNDRLKIYQQAVITLANPTIDRLLKAVKFKMNTPR